MRRHCKLDLCVNTVYSVSHMSEWQHWRTSMYLYCIGFFVWRTRNGVFGWIGTYFWFLRAFSCAYAWQETRSCQNQFLLVGSLKCLRVLFLYNLHTLNAISRVTEPNSRQLWKFSKNSSLSSKKNTFHCIRYFKPFLLDNIKDSICEKVRKFRSRWNQNRMKVKKYVNFTMYWNSKLRALTQFRFVSIFLLRYP